MVSVVQRTHSTNRQVQRTENDRITGDKKKIGSGSFNESGESVRRWLFKTSVGYRCLFKVPFDKKNPFLATE